MVAAARDRQRRGIDSGTGETAAPERQPHGIPLSPMPETPRTDAARAAVLARLWGALAREPIPGLGAREWSGATLVIKVPDGRTLRGPAAAARPFAVAPMDFALDLDGARHADPAALVRALDLPVPTTALEAELDNSVVNLALAREAQPVPDGGQPTLNRAVRSPDPLAYLEQSVVDGHPLHPCCRTRMGLSRDEVIAYAPEHRPIVSLHTVIVPERRWLGVESPPTLVVHPWQRAHVLDAYPWLTPSDEIRPARPLMSLRTLALVGAPNTHVKTAVDVQMTSAIRTVSPAAIHNGPLVSALLRDLTAGTPTLSVLAEFGAGAVLVDGEPSRSLAMVWREGPSLGPGELAMPLAALAAPSNADGRPLAVEIVTLGYGRDPLAFLDALARLMLPPLLTLLHRGVGLEAHGQNLLAVLRHGRLHRLLYRDFGGLRLSPARLRAKGFEPPPTRGDLATDDPRVLRTKLLASAVSTVLGETIAVLGREYGFDEQSAWARVAAAARGHDGAEAAGLFADTLPIKAMTAMRLASDPVADLWSHVPNPMAGLP